MKNKLGSISPAVHSCFGKKDTTHNNTHQGAFHFLIQILELTKLTSVLEGWIPKCKMEWRWLNIAFSWTWCITFNALNKTVEPAWTSTHVYTYFCAPVLISKAELSGDAVAWVISAKDPKQYILMMKWQALQLLQQWLFLSVRSKGVGVEMLLVSHPVSKGRAFGRLGKSKRQSNSEVVFFYILIFIFFLLSFVSLFMTKHLLFEQNHCFRWNDKCFLKQYQIHFASKHTSDF